MSLADVCNNEEVCEMSGFFRKGTALVMVMAFISILAVSLPDLAYSQAKKLIDDYESGSITNLMGGKTNVYVKAPSKAMMSFRKDSRNGAPTTALMLKFDKKNEGGPFDSGGWCGYYTLLKKAHPAVYLEQGATAAEAEEEVYFDASAYRSITMWVKAGEGKANFVIGVADAHWDKIGDSVKSEEIGKYLPAGKVTSQWQKAVIPLDEFFIDTAKLSSISVSFEADCFPEGTGKGAIFVDDIALE